MKIIENNWKKMKNIENNWNKLKNLSPPPLPPAQLWHSKVGMLSNLFFGSFCSPSKNCPPLLWNHSRFHSYAHTVARPTGLPEALRLTCVTKSPGGLLLFWFSLPSTNPPTEITPFQQTKIKHTHTHPASVLQSICIATFVFSALLKLPYLHIGPSHCLMIMIAGSPW